MKLGYSIIYVKSVPDTLSFYEAAFGIPTRFCVPTNDYAELEMEGSSTLAFANEKFVESNIGTNVFQVNRIENPTSAGVQISLVIDASKSETVEAVVQRAQNAGAVLVKEPATKPWGQIVAYIKDCNGFLVEICTPVKAD